MEANEWRGIKKKCACKAWLNSLADNSCDHHTRGKHLDEAIYI